MGPVSGVALGAAALYATCFEIFTGQLVSTYSILQ